MSHLFCTLQQKPNGYHWTWMEIVEGMDEAVEYTGIEDTLEGAIGALNDHIRKTFPVGTLQADEELPEFDESKGDKYHDLRKKVLQRRQARKRRAAKAANSKSG